MAKFDLTDFLGTIPVPNSGTEPEQIVKLSMEMIHEDPRNFYTVDGVEALAANIQLCGLMDPLRVRPSADGYYTIVSGHRRFAALKLLAAEDPRYEAVPCVVETGDASPAMTELRLIFANADTRRMTPADIGRQAQRVQELLYELKEQGVEFPGRMREHVAEACKVSKSKLSRLAAIKAHLAPDILQTYWTGEKTDLSEATSYELSRLPADVQRQVIDAWRGKDAPCNHLLSISVKSIVAAIAALEELKCHGAEPCHNQDRKIAHIIRTLLAQPYNSVECGKHCCGSCPRLASCRDVCANHLDNQRSLKAQRRADAQAAAAKQEEKERPDIELISAIWQRFGELRERAGLSDEEYLERIGIPYFSDKAEMSQRETGSLDGLTPASSLPYGYHCGLLEVKRWCAAADALGCSVDDLMLRKQSAQVSGQQLVLAGWMPGDTTPAHDCECVAMVDLGDGAEPIKTGINWTNGAWRYGPRRGAAAMRDKVLAWIEIPEWPGKVMMCAHDQKCRRSVDFCSYGGGMADNG